MILNHCNNIVQKPLVNILRNIFVVFHKFLRSENESLRKTVGTKDEKIAELNKKIGGLEMAIEFKNHTIDSAKKVSLPVRKTGSK